MSEAIWYYAQGDKEQGPVTLVQIKALIQAGKIKPDDLVWKDGMEDWLPAKTVPGLLSGEAPLPEPAAAARAKTAAVAPKIEAPARPAEPTAPPAAAAGPPPPVEVPPSESSAPKAAPRAAAASAPSTAVSPRQIGRWVGWGLVIVGLVFVLMSRGCDSVGQRYVERVRAYAAAAEPPSQELRAGALRADADYRLWNVLRETVFVFASLLLVAGLFTTALGGEGAEKWMCLVMLAIVLFGLYVGGGLIR
jgi:hypothetical protein